MAGRDILAVDYAGDALHVNRNQYPHLSSLLIDSATRTPM
jgi:hypothetical protein